MSQIQIRPAVINDIPHLMQLDHSSASESVWQLELRRESGMITAVFREARLPRPTPVIYPRDPRSLSDAWKKFPAVMTALAGEIPIGYLCMQESTSSSVAWVTDLVVSAQNRRQGVGSALLTSAQEWAQDRSHRRLILEMQSKNIPMIRLAQKFGYEFCGYNDHYYLTQDVTLYFGRMLK